MGYAISASALTTALQSCQTASEGALGWTPQFLSPTQGELVSQIVEAIIPRTDTPGAVDVGVPQFVDVMLQKYLPEAQQQQFTQGLELVDSESNAAHQKSFTELTAEEQDAVLRKMATSGGTGQEFFAGIRQMTMLGYYTSKPVGTEVLNFDPVPGDYIGCIPIEETENVIWTI